LQAFDSVKRWASRLPSSAQPMKVRQKRQSIRPAGSQSRRHGPEIRPEVRGDAGQQGQGLFQLWQP
jgi:hypothetical protein